MAKAAAKLHRYASATVLETAAKRLGRNLACVMQVSVQTRSYCCPHNMSKSVLILAGDTDGNLGDKAILEATCRDLRRVYPSVEITLVSGNPARERERLGATAIPRGLAGVSALIRAARKSDVVLCGGGGLFQDDTSLIKMPYWALRLLFIRLFARRIVGYSLGVGPLSWLSSRLSARLAFLCMNEISVRDPEAVSTAQPLTRKRVRIVPDPALLTSSTLQTDAENVMRKAGIPLDGRPLVAVALRRWFHHKPTLVPHKFAVKYRLRKIPGSREMQKLLQLLAKTLDKVVDTSGAHIIFMPTYDVEHEADSAISEGVRERMRSTHTTLLNIFEPQLYQSIAARTNVMLGGRMHPTILAAGQGIPIVGLAYNQKFRGFFRLLNREDKLIDIERFVHTEDVEELVLLVLNAITEKAIAAEQIEQLRSETRRFNEHILSAPRSTRNQLEVTVGLEQRSE